MLYLLSTLASLAYNQEQRNSPVLCLSCPESGARVFSEGKFYMKPLLEYITS